MDTNQNRQLLNSAISKGAAPKSKRDTFIDEAKEIKAVSLGLLSASANVSHLIKEAIGAGVKMDMDKLNAAANTLANDLSSFRTELATIDERTMTTLNTITHTTDDIEVMSITIAIANDYQNWQDRFGSITGPNLELITEMCTGEAGEE